MSYAASRCRKKRSPAKTKSAAGRPPLDGAAAGQEVFPFLTEERMMTERHKRSTRIRALAVALTIWLAIGSVMAADQGPRRHTQGEVTYSFIWLDTKDGPLVATWR